MKKIIFILLILLPNFSYAEDYEQVEWSLGKTAALVVALDWLQTRDIVNKKDKGFYETNPVLGRYPTLGEVNRYFIGLSYIYYMLNQTQYDEYVNWFIIVEHGYAVANNHRIGIRIKF